MNVSTNRRVAGIILTVVGCLLLQPLARADDASANLYQTKCASCHGADGTANTAVGKVLKVRDLHDPDVQKQTDDELAAIISKGKDKMPEYDKTLKPAEIKGLVAYVRELAAKK